MNHAAQHARALAMAAYCLRHNCPAHRVEFWLRVSEGISNNHRLPIRPSDERELNLKIRAHIMRQALKNILDMKQSGALP